MLLHGAQQRHTVPDAAHDRTSNAMEVNHITEQAEEGKRSEGDAGKVCGVGVE